MLQKQFSVKPLDESLGGNDLPLDGLTKIHDEFQNVSQGHDASEAPSIGSVPNQREGCRLLDYHRFNALVKRQLVIQYDYLSVVWE